ncbi:hypothetical protein [Pseudomonas chlororaphis]
MNPIFKHLTPAILANVDDQLTNNEVSDNEEMRNFFVDELGLTAEQADAAVALRPQYMGRIFLTGQSPLFLENAVAFDPLAKGF